MAQYSNTFLPSLNADLSNLGTCTKNSALTVEACATQKWQQVFAGFVPSNSAESRLANMADIVAEFTQAGGAPILD